MLLIVGAGAGAVAAAAFFLSFFLIPLLVFLKIKPIKNSAAPIIPNITASGRRRFSER